jgi:hypothetical protein
MHFIKIYTFLKTHTSKTLECLCPVSPYMFRSLRSDHPQWRLFLLHCYFLPCCCSSAQLYSGMWLCLCKYNVFNTNRFDLQRQSHIPG